MTSRDDLSDKDLTPPKRHGGLPNRTSGRRRDRHGRGLRGPLLPPALPGALSRSEQFDEHVRAALQRLNRQWERRLEKLEVAVEDVPPGEAATWDATIPFGRAVPALSGQPDRLILYRRPIEARAYDSHDLGLLVLDVIVQQLAQLWNMPPTSVDPGYRD